MKTDSRLKVWMDMYQNGAIVFQNRYELFRADSERGIELANPQKNTKRNSA